MACRFGDSMVLLGAKGSRYETTLVLSLALGAIGLLTPSTAYAHFKINTPASWMSQDSVGGPQKNGPCAAVPNTSLGDSAGTPTKTVTVLQSGQTVSVSITVTVAHPGWFRIALAEGASSTQTHSTIADPQAQTGTNCTPAIMSNPVWSSTQPIIADGLPAGSTASTQQTGTQTFQVTIPKSASCTSTQPCALQVIMVMTDHPASDCYYHHCADISIGSAADAGSDSASADAPIAKDASGAAHDALGAGGGSGSAGAGGAGGAGAGGSTGAGGSVGQGGVTARGGSTGSGGVTSSGGSTGAGGSGEGGVTGKGGSTATGGITGTGGGAVSGGGTGGVSGGGGSTGAGGVTGSGGSAGSGGVAGAGGPSGSAGIGGGTGAPAKSGSGSGCNLSSSRSGSPWGMTAAAMLGALVALRGRRRRR
jgi:MYXO-CTERM domain-containing protein